EPDAVATARPVPTVQPIRQLPRPGQADVPFERTVVSDSMLFTLTRVATAAELGPRAAGVGHELLAATAVIENTGSGALPYDGGAFRLADALGATYSPLPQLSGALGIGMLK